MNSMPIQEIWQIKENLSEKLWGKTSDEISKTIKPNVDDMKCKIDELRKKNVDKQTI